MQEKSLVCDDKGLALTHVKIMSEPSNCPPKWTDEFLAQVIKGVKPNPTSDVHWTVQFAQPASDYLAFRIRSRKITSLWRMSLFEKVMILLQALSKSRTLPLTKKFL
ncbi:protein phosphatase 1 regulatory subunit [Trichonephila clavata]|uniref:Protein phosphatase 1 regulatory subunit n=1 Tax=Trichonephila clavata TaxID=2740835 RepID=A0A8X6K335_TRICU|nr:protein phosphatase 1 regulatory subunit [Trichonephila clavata]